MALKVCLIAVLALTYISTTSSFTAHENQTDAASQLRFHNSNASAQYDSRGSLMDAFRPVTAFFGRVTKGVVYGGAFLASQFNAQLCTFLTHETEKENTDEPVEFTFNNPRDGSQAFRIYADDKIDEELIRNSHFDPQQMTFIFVHGWMGGINHELWLTEAKDTAIQSPRIAEITSSRQRSRMRSLLNRNITSGIANSSSRMADNFRPNVIVVDWSSFAKGSLYTATTNTIKVGTRLGRVLAQLSQVGGIDPLKMHCLGHSLGAHICGLAAREAFSGGSNPSFQVEDRQSNITSLSTKMGRITALDGGGFCYELGIKNESTYVGLRPSDANLVDGYYTNRSPFGNRYQMARYNVRVNNGFFQSRCSTWKNPEFASEYFKSAVSFLLGNAMNNDVLTCDHYFATRFAHLKIPQDSCSYVAYACDSYENFLLGQCGLCDTTDHCYSMDFEYQRALPSIDHALAKIRDESQYRDESSFNQNGNEYEPRGGVPYDKRRVYYLATDKGEPYCGNTYRIRVHIKRDVAILRDFKSAWFQLQLVGPDGSILKLKNSGRRRVSQIVKLNGPWLPIDDDSDFSKSKSFYGIDNRTLTAFVALQPIGDQKDVSARPILPNIKDIKILIDNDVSRHNNAQNPIESISIDYLSSENQKVRAKYSSEFKPKDMKIIYKRLRTSDMNSQNLEDSP